MCRLSDVAPSRRAPRGDAGGEPFHRLRDGGAWLFTEVGQSDEAIRTERLMLHGNHFRDLRCCRPIGLRLGWPSRRNSPVEMACRGPRRSRSGSERQKVSRPPCEVPPTYRWLASPLPSWGAGALQPLLTAGIGRPPAWLVPHCPRDPPTSWADPHGLRGRRRPTNLRSLPSPAVSPNRGMTVARSSEDRKRPAHAATFSVVVMRNRSSFSANTSSYCTPWMPKMSNGSA